MSFQAEEIQRRVQRIFGDESGVQITDEDVVDWINDAIREIYLQQDDLTIKTTTLQAVAEQGEYNLPNGVMMIQTVSFDSDGTYYDLRYVNGKTMSEYFNGWDGDESTETPTYYTRGRTPNTLLLWPYPASTVNDAIKIVYSSEGEFIETLGESIELPNHLFSTVLEYCLMKAYEMDENWEGADRKAKYVQSTIDSNYAKESWFGRQSYPVVTTMPEDYV
jgi:hypothetical protein